jgi:hypothetical protein
LRRLPGSQSEIVPRAITSVPFAFRRDGDGDGDGAGAGDGAAVADLVVASTHVYWRSSTPRDVPGTSGASPAALLRGEARALSARWRAPLVLCGDFNASKCNGKCRVGGLCRALVARRLHVVVRTFGRGMILNATSPSHLPLFLSLSLSLSLCLSL